MRFVKEHVNTVPIEDTVFAIVKKAAEAKKQVGDANVVDATIGSLYDETGTLVAFESVFAPYDKIDKKVKAAYAGSFTGNESFRKQVAHWVLDGSGCHLSQSVIATPGGTGAISITFQNILDEGETVVLPEIAWGSYALMATMDNLKTKTYSLFENDHFHLASFKKTCEEVLKQQNKLLVVLNDPCHNPTGYSLSEEEWQEVIAFLNECGKKAPVVLLNDIAYVDFSYQPQKNAYMKYMNDLSENVMVVVAFSCSKALTSYGMRCGAALILGQKEESVREIEIVFEKAARALWSNVNNSAMENFTYVTTENLENYKKEKQMYVDLLKQRSHIFVEEAKACDLEIYPYKEGFFVSVAMPDNQVRDVYHEALMKQHIYTVKVNKGIRVAVCSLSVDKCKGLAKRMKEILNQVVF